MRTADLDFSYPPELVATEPRADYRILLSEDNHAAKEISKAELFNLFTAGDVLVINDTKVLKRRVFTTEGVEILFLSPVESVSFLNNASPVTDGISKEWEVLFPARDLKIGDKINLPGGVQIELLQKGLPQRVRVSEGLLDENYFSKNAHLALPPYIQKARSERTPRADDDKWYQTAWAEEAGSLAAPTASLHFTSGDLADLLERKVNIATLTLHVGIGTFLPVKSENLDEHVMHKEWVHIPATSITKIKNAKAKGRRVWALGTTAVRSLESWAHGKLLENESASGHTDLFIRPGFEFKVVDAILTNFHQPRSTLIALVSAFAGLERVQKTYGYAIDKRFRLFSYGDLSVWLK